MKTYQRLLGPPECAAAALVSRTPGRSPLVNSMPAASSARYRASDVDCFASAPFSTRVTVLASDASLFSELPHVPADSRTSHVKLNCPHGMGEVLTQPQLVRETLRLLRMARRAAMELTVLSVRIPEQLKEQLDYLSRSTKRSKAYLAAEALGDYVKKNAWRAKELHEAISEADKGVFVSHEAMVAWVDSLGTDKELAPPKPDIRRPKKKAS